MGDRLLFIGTAVLFATAAGVCSGVWLQSPAAGTFFGIVVYISARFVQVVAALAKSMAPL